jgi:hypothetical protein
MSTTQEVDGTGTTATDGLAERACTGSSALVELGVTTGLSLLFSLLQLNWRSGAASGMPTYQHEQYQHINAGVEIR